MAENSLDYFFDVFAAGAGSQLSWALRLGKLRAFVTPNGDRDIDYGMCPISAIATLVEGYYFNAALGWQIGATLLKLSSTASARILAAADGKTNDPNYDPALRARLLRICGLEEETHGAP